MEHKSGQRRRLKTVLLICALGVGILLLPVTASWMVRHCYVEMAVRAFRSNPSQAGADKLIDLLDRRSPTHGQAARILRLLLEPKVVTRSAYAIGRKPTISTLLPFYLHFNTITTCRVDALAEGQDSLTPQSSMSTHVGTGPHVWTLPAATDNYGKFSAELRFSYSLAAPLNWHYPTNPVTRFVYDLLDRIAPRRRSAVSKEKPYQVGFSVPLHINVVPAAEAERVQLLSSPELDARMRDALHPDTSADTLFRLPLHIFARRLPANVVFDCFLELPDGARIRSSWGRHLIGYAGRDFEVNLLASEYQGHWGMDGAKAVFEPDPNYAFEEPTIKSIWNGRLEFPIYYESFPWWYTGK
ncbi:MAG: hypothetical protein M1376_21790 [Planctomycetes bacterium]|nr:hypothetical protein [Planctomycetota bacterium]